MSTKTVKKIISDNYYVKNHSFVYFLHEECCFFVEKFPFDFTAFIKRIDFAVRAYLLNDISLLEDEGFELQK